MYKIRVFYLAFKILRKILKYTVTEIEVSILSLAASLFFIKDFKTAVFMQRKKQLKPLGKHFYLVLIAD